MAIRPDNSGPLKQSDLLVDARPLETPLTGIGRYIAGLLDPTNTRPGAELANGIAKRGQSVEPGLLNVLMRGPSIPDAAWNELVLARVMRAHAVMWAPTGQVPWQRTRTRILATIHDTLEATDPTLPLRRRLSLRNAHAAAASRADIVIANSRTTAINFSRYYGREVDAIIEPAPTLHPPPEGALRWARALLEPARRPWLLSVGAPIRRKNTTAAAAAIRRLGTGTLILVGGDGDASVEQELTPHAASGRL